ncbi:MAG: M56 family metallopeptidase [Planctomycetota bacterium]
MMGSSLNLPTILWAHIAQFSIGITLVAALIWLSGRRWPQVAFLLCMLAFAKCLVPPVITSPAGLFTRSESVAFNPFSLEPKEQDIVRWKQTLPDRSPQIAAVEMDGPNSGFSLTHGNEGAFGPSGQPLAAAAFYPAAAGSVPNPWLWTFLAMWLGGLLYIGFHAIRKLLDVTRMTSEMYPASLPIRRLTAELKKEIGLGRPVRVLISEDNYGPACLGIIRPTLVLPQTLVDTFPTRLLRPILAHELVHARRGDAFWGYLQFLTQIVWWFHPLVWWVGRRASDLCESCCDSEVVLSAKCKASDYAESLVRVLALKSSLRPVPLSNAMSATQITRTRLQQIMNLKDDHSNPAALASWSLTLGLAILLIPGLQWTSQQQDTKETDSVAAAIIDDDEEEPVDWKSLTREEIRTRVNYGLENGKWQSVINLLTPIVEDDPQDASAIFYLGYALHADGQWKKAITFHERATKFAGTRPAALYNWGCALALLGKEEAALEKIRSSIQAGFVVGSSLEIDPDLKELRNSDDFKKLVKQIKSWHELDFWLGEWKVRNADGEEMGTSSVTAQEKGHLIVEKWTNSMGATGTSNNYFHPEENKWKQNWVDDDGSILELTGEFKDGAMRYTGIMRMKFGKSFQTRMQLVPQENGNVDQLIERFDPETSEWKMYFQGTYHSRQRPKQASRLENGFLFVAHANTNGQCAPLIME